MSNWKDAHANAAGKALDHEFVREVIDELLGNLGLRGAALPEYGIKKVAMYAAQVARAQALGFDAALLSMSDEESDAAALRLAQMAVEAGKPVWALDPDTKEEG